MTIPAQRPVPFDTGVGSQNDIHLFTVGEMFEKVRRRRRFPQKLICPSRAAVTKQDAIASQLNVPLHRQIAQPCTIGEAGVPEGVLVADAGEMIIARVGVAALAIGQVVGNGVVVIALNTLDAMIAKQGKDAIRIGSKGP